MALAIILITVAVVIFFGLAMTSQRKHSVKPETEVEPLQKVEVKVVSESNYYNPIDAHVMQLLESTWIMANSKILETIAGRYSFSLSKIEALQQYKSNERYLTDVQVGLDRYRSLYPDKPFMQYQQTLLMEPAFANLNALYCECISKCITKYTQDEKEHIEGLIRPLAKTKRVQLLKSKINTAKDEIKRHCERSENYAEVREVIENLEREINSIYPD